MPFFVISAAGLAVICLIYLKLPSLRNHIDSNVNKVKVTYRNLLINKQYIYAYLAASLGTMAAFMIIPYITPQLQNNLHYPRNEISILYFVGGIISFLAMRISGYMVDKYGATITSLLGVVIIAPTLLFGFIEPIFIIPLIITFTPFMVGMSIRNVASFANSTKIPTPFDRAGFMSLISCFQHLFSSIGAILSASILLETADGMIANMDVIGIISLILFFATIPFIALTEMSLKTKSQNI